MAEDTKTPETTTPKTIKEVLDAEKGLDELDLDPKILDSVDLTLPENFQLFNMAAELVEHLANYARAKVTMRSARAQGNGKRAEEMNQLMSLSRIAAAYIQSEYPGVKALADEIAQVRAKQAKDQRLALLAAED